MNNFKVICLAATFCLPVGSSYAFQSEAPSPSISIPLSVPLSVSAFAPAPLQNMDIQDNAGPAIYQHPGLTRAASVSAPLEYALSQALATHPDDAPWMDRGTLKLHPAHSWQAGWCWPLQRTCGWSPAGILGTRFSDMDESLTDFDTSSKLQKLSGMNYLAITADYFSTSILLKQGNSEGNFILGKNPSNSKLLYFSLIRFVAVYLLSNDPLIEPETKVSALKLTNAVCWFAVGNNVAIMANVNNIGEDLGIGTAAGLVMGYVIDW